MLVILRCEPKSHVGRGPGSQYGLARKMGVSLLDLEKEGCCPSISTAMQGSPAPQICRRTDLTVASTKPPFLLSIQSTRIRSVFQSDVHLGCWWPHPTR